MPRPRWRHSPADETERNIMKHHRNSRIKKENERREAKRRKTLLPVVLREEEELARGFHTSPSSHTAGVTDLGSRPSALQACNSRTSHPPSFLVWRSRRSSISSSTCRPPTSSIGPDSGRSACIPKVAAMSLEFYRPARRRWSPTWHMLVLAETSHIVLWITRWLRPCPAPRLTILVGACRCR